MSTSNLIDAAIVLAILAGCAFWIWWEEQERREQRRKAQAILERLKPVPEDHQEPATIPSPLYQQSDSGGNHPS